MGRRSKSAVRISGPKRSVGATPVATSAASTSKKTSIGKYATPSLATKTSGIRKTSITTPSVASALFKRSTSNMTPSSYRSRSKSPFKIGSEQDKDWVNVQLTKVHNFLQYNQNCPESILHVLRPPITIETFVFVINILFKEINPSLNVQNANYKTVVANTLKMLHYPGNIKNSFLQTVNTKHAWRDVVSMFSWLVDLINTINSVPVQAPADDLKRKKIECITDFLTKRYLSYNGTGNREQIDREFGETFAKILNVDANELSDIKSRVSKLRKGKEEQLKKLENKQIKNENLQREIKRMQNEIDTYYENKKEKEDDEKYAITALKDRRERLKAAIKMKKERVAELTGIINKQSYTVADKKRIVQHIDELQHTISLKKESNKEKKTLKDASDFKLVEAKKELQTQVYRFNNRVMKLASIEPALKLLYLKEKDFLSTEFQNDMEELSKTYNKFKNMFASEIAKINFSLANMKTDASKIKQQKKTLQESIEILTKTITAVEKKIEMIDKEVEMLTKQRQDGRNNFSRKVASLKDTETTLEKNKQELAELRETHKEKFDDLERKKQMALNFFRKLHDIIVGNLQEMNNIRTEIFDMLKDCLTKVAETEGNVLDDLHNLDEVKK
ncbi:hypothetical protein Zmor_026122 [Zophobas morio]|uniref:Kinetochore protein NDC80 n=1 Tax=Zophobas morio TaxID=2755281 RepID=A0AA38HY98_9CUCU|nr:hypothetical protein Zmor_026122 [Zophobas morio]